MCHKKIERKIDKVAIQKYFYEFPVTAIPGPRQGGKTTIASEFQFDHYFSLENPRDEARLENPQVALENLRGVIVIDEIQKMPELFPLSFTSENDDKSVRWREQYISTIPVENLIFSGRIQAGTGAWN